MNRYDSYFQHINNELTCEGIPVKKLASEYGTPLYIYSERGFQDHYRRIDKALSDAEHLICYSIKSNSNISIITLMKEMGSGMDVVSAGEIYRALKAGVDPSRIVFAGVGKRYDEIAYAIDSKILMFNCESFQEVEEINRISAQKGVITGIAIRVNPDVDANTHHYITTGKKENKFGISPHQLMNYLGTLAGLKNVSLRGIHCHIGSQITTYEPYIEAVQKVADLIEDLRSSGFNDFTHINLGGGFGIIYDEEGPFSLEDWSREIVHIVKPLGLKIIVEPGRYISGNTGMLLIEVLYKKQADTKTFIITDGAMNDLIRPSLYGAFQHIVNCDRREGKEVADIVGPICESGDFFAKDREITLTEKGDHLAILSAGAYCMSMASRYNTRALPAEVMIGTDSRVRLIRKRDTYEEMVRNEILG